MSTLFYAAVKTFFRVFHTIYNRLEVNGATNIPDAPVVVASNHASNIDPPLVGSIWPTQLRYLAKDSLFNAPLFGAAIRALGAVPVVREDGQRAGAVMKLLLDRLSVGESVLVFPEGSRSRDGKLQKLEGGVAFLSVKAGVPLVPVYISGSHDVCGPGAKFPRPSKLRVSIAPPISPGGDGSDKDKRERMLLQLDAALHDMEREAIR